MSRHTKNIRTQDDVHKACGAKRIGWDSDDESDEEPEFGSSNIEVEEEYRLLRLAADYLYKEKRLVELQRMCFMALTSRVFRKKQEIHRECRFLALQVCMAKGDSFFAYNLARALLLSNLHNNRVWNLFIQVNRSSYSFGHFQRAQLFRLSRLLGQVVIIRLGSNQIKEVSSSLNCSWSYTLPLIKT